MKRWSDVALNASSLQFLSSVKRLIASSLRFFLSVKHFIAVIFYGKTSFNASSPLLFRRNSMFNASSPLLFKVNLPTSAVLYCYRPAVQCTGSCWLQIHSSCSCCGTRNVTVGSSVLLIVLLRMALWHQRGSKLVRHYVLAMFSSYEIYCTRLSSADEGVTPYWLYLQLSLSPWFLWDPLHQEDQQLQQRYFSGRPSTFANSWSLKRGNK